MDASPAPRVLLGLPPTVLVGSPQAGPPAALACEDFFHLVNTELVGEGSGGRDEGPLATEGRFWDIHMEPVAPA